MNQIMAMKSQHDSELQALYSMGDEEGIELNSERKMDLPVSWNLEDDVYYLFCVNFIGRRVHQAEEKIVELQSQLAAREEELSHFDDEVTRAKVTSNMKSC